MMQTDIKTASEIYLQLGITEPFKVWIAKQPGFDAFESFYGKLPDGKLGKDYRLKPKQVALLLPSVPSKVAAKAVKKKKSKLRPNVVIAGQVSAYWFSNNRGLPYNKNSLELLGKEATAKCKELGIVMGGKLQREIISKRKKWMGWVRTYPLEILESLTFPIEPL